MLHAQKDLILHRHHFKSLIPSLISVTFQLLPTNLRGWEEEKEEIWWGREGS